MPWRQVTKKEESHHIRRIPNGFVKNIAKWSREDGQDIIGTMTRNVEKRCSRGGSKSQDQKHSQETLNGVTGLKYWVTMGREWEMGKAVQNHIRGVGLCRSSITTALEKDDSIILNDPENKDSKTQCAHSDAWERGHKGWHKLERRGGHLHTHSGSAGALGGNAEGCLAV